MIDARSQATPAMRTFTRLWRYVQRGVVVFVAAASVACGQRSDTVVSIALHPTKPHILYLATDEAVYKTRDEGKTWERFSGELSRTRVINLAIDPHLPANVFAGTNGDGTYKSPDGGRSWHQFNAGLQRGTISAIVNQVLFHPVERDTMYAATTVGAFQSTDGGRTWESRLAGMTEINFVVSLAIDPVKPTTMYAGTTGGVYRTTNGADSWVKVTEGMVAFDAKMASMALGVNDLLIDPTDTDIVYAGTTQGLFISTNGANNWRRSDNELGTVYVSAVQVHPTQPKTLYLATSEGVWKSDDRGGTWMQKGEGVEATSIRSLQLHPTDPQVLYIGTNGGGLYRSRDGGDTWERVPFTSAG